VEVLKVDDETISMCTAGTLDVGTVVLLRFAVCAIKIKLPLTCTRCMLMLLLLSCRNRTFVSPYLKMV